MPQIKHYADIPPAQVSQMEYKHICSTWKEGSAIVGPPPIIAEPQHWEEGNTKLWWQIALLKWYENRPCWSCCMHSFQRNHQNTGFVGFFGCSTVKLHVMPGNGWVTNCIIPLLAYTMDNNTPFTPLSMLIETIVCFQTLFLAKQKTIRPYPPWTLMSKADQAAFKAGFLYSPFKHWSDFTH